MTWPSPAADYLAEKGMTLSLFELLATVIELEDELEERDRAGDRYSGFYSFPTAAKIANRCGRSRQGAINGLIALRTRGLVTDFIGDQYDSDRWLPTELGREVAGG